MTWFKLDDSFGDHPKVIEAGNAATGLWVRAATWSARHLTDGQIPRRVVESLGSRGEIERVTAARLWVPVEDSYLIPDWAEFQPSSGEVRDKRSKHAARMREWRAAHREDDGSYRP